MRVIAGKAKGCRLKSPPDQAVRPTLDRVREALFSIIASEVENARFLDLFAGTGANGIEALSRGAAHCDFVDSASSSLDIVRQNLQLTHLDSSADTFQYQLPEDLHRLKSHCAGYDLAFADPPRDFPFLADLLAAIADTELLKPDGVFILEHDSNVELPVLPGQLEEIRESRYGNTTLSFFRGRG